MKYYFLIFIFFISLFLITNNTTHAISISETSFQVGDTISIQGEDFGNEMDVYSKVCFADYQHCYYDKTKGIETWSNNRIDVIIPINIDVSGEVFVTRTSIKTVCPSTGAACYQEKYENMLGGVKYSLKPKITSISKKIVAEGEEVTIKGTGFGLIQGNIKTNERVNLDVLNWSYDQITIKVQKVYYPADTLIVQNSVNNTDFITIIFSKALTNDTYSHYQAYLQKLNVVEAWNKTEGEGVTIAVIDSGINTNHTDLEGNFWINNDEIPSNKKDDDNNGYIDDYYGYNFAENSAELTPQNDHGTMVAGIIAAKKNNNKGISGIAPKSKIMVLQVENKEGIKIENILKAIRYSADNGADIINLSLGGIGFTTDYTEEYNDVIKYAYNKGILIVASSGNGDVFHVSYARNLDIHPNSPVCNDNNENMVLGVSSIDYGNKKSNFADYGKCVDISAYGEDIISLSHPAFSSYGEYNIESGTSFSAPQISGLAALIKSNEPSLINWEIMQKLMQTGDSISKFNDDSYAGKIGSLANIIKAMDYKKLPAPEITSVELIDNNLLVKGKYFSSSLKLDIQTKKGTETRRTFDTIKLKDISTISKSIVFPNNFKEILVSLENNRGKSNEISYVYIPTEKKQNENISKNKTSQIYNNTPDLKLELKKIKYVTTKSNQKKFQVYIKAVNIGESDIEGTIYLEYFDNKGKSVLDRFTKEGLRQGESKIKSIYISKENKNKIFKFIIDPDNIIKENSLDNNIIEVKIIKS